LLGRAAYGFFFVSLLGIFPPKFSHEDTKGAKTTKKRKESEEDYCSLSWLRTERWAYGQKSLFPFPFSLFLRVLCAFVSLCEILGE
jgi:hypothetical protein